MKTIAILLFSLFLCSCSSVNLFQSDATKDNNFRVLTQQYQHILAPDDKISISVWNHDDLSVGSSFSIYNTHESFGKWILIEKNNTATIPYIGIDTLGGLTLKQAEERIAKKLSKNLQKPIVEIKVLNREITVLGEVKSPGNYIIEKELNTLIEAIGKAEGINYYGNSKEIKIIRNNKSYVVDLTDMDDFEKNNIYLQAKDIVYIPSKKGKKIDLKAPVIIPFASLITALGIIFSVLNK